MKESLTRGVLTLTYALVTFVANSPIEFVGSCHSRTRRLATWRRHRVAMAQAFAFTLCSLTTVVASAQVRVIVGEDLGTKNLFAWLTPLAQAITLALGIFFTFKVAMKFFTEDNGAWKALLSLIAGIVVTVGGASLIEMVRRKMVGS